MKIKTSRILSPFILVPSFFEVRLKANETLIEQCSLLCSVKEFQAVNVIAGLINAPVARLYETIAKNDYSNPEAFIIENIDDAHRGRMILCVATGFRLRGDLQVTEKLLAEASKIATKYNDVVTLYQTRKELAITHSLNGNHNQALKILGDAFALTPHIYKFRPALHFDHLNSCAVELNEVGRFEEAQKFSEVTLASPFAHKYDGWHQTRAEIKVRGRRASYSRVFIDKVFEPDNVRRLVPRPKEHDTHQAPIGAAPSVTRFADWKADMAKGQPSKDTKHEEFDPGESVAEIVRLLYRADERQIKEVLDLLKRSEKQEAGEP